MATKWNPGTYGLMARFETPDELVVAARKTREAGYRWFEAYAPFPVHGLSEGMGFSHTKLPIIVLIGGLFGVGAGYFLQYYLSVVHYPLNVGGRPMHSWPSFIPVTFELGILCAAFSAVLGMLALNGLPRPHHPVFNIDDFSRASQDSFFLCLQSRDEQFHETTTREFLNGLGPMKVYDVPH